jgi:hypothetical protein
MSSSVRFLLTPALLLVAFCLLNGQETPSGSEVQASKQKNISAKEYAAAARAHRHRESSTANSRQQAVFLLTQDEVTAA